MNKIETKKIVNRFANTCEVHVQSPNCDPISDNYDIIMCTVI